MEKRKISQVRKDLSELKRASRKLLYMIDVFVSAEERANSLSNIPGASVEKIARLEKATTNLNANSFIERSIEIINRYSVGIEALEPREHAIFQDVYLDAKKYKDIAKERDCSVSYIQNTVSEIIKKLSSSGTGTKGI